MVIEVEQRFKVQDADAMVSKLAEHGVRLTGTQHIIDEWYTPTYVHSQDDENKWFDEDHGVAYRIRRTEQADGTFTCVLDSKQLTDHNNHDTFKEEVLMESDEAAMRAYVADKDYYNWLLIDKQRYKFSSPQPELVITMDTVTGVKQELGVDTVLEIEYEGEGTRDHALKTIGAFAASLGLSDKDRFDKSLTVESMRVLARFQ